MKTNQGGFSLIELMIVVAIIGILASIAIPTYGEYVARSQVSEGFSCASAQKLAVAEHYQTNGIFPSNNIEANALSCSGKFVESVSIIDEGVLLATMGSQSSSAISGKTFSLNPTANGGSISWDCEAITIEQKYLPTACRASTSSDLPSETASASASSGGGVCYVLGDSGTVEVPCGS